MRMMLAISALTGLSACSLGIPERMGELTGQNVDVAISKLGFPNDEKVIDGQRVYTWSSNGCIIRVIADQNKTIKNSDGEGNMRGCAWFAQRLAQ